MSDPHVQPEPICCGRSTLHVAGIVLGAYLLLLNPYWTPGGDSELFLAAARSIVRGEGYVYNGESVAIAPPAWPYLLAGVMWISPTFLFIKLVTLLLMTIASVLAHRVLLRLGPPAWATGSVILGALLVPAYSLTFWLHSEPLFCALAWAAMLSAVRLVEDRRRRWSMLWLILCCAAMAATRWTSGLQWGLSGAVLLSGIRWTGRPLLSRPEGAPAWLGLGLGLSFVVIVAVFLLFYAGGIAEASPQLPVTTQDAETGRPSLLDNTIFHDEHPAREYLQRLAGAGHWPAWALWYPMRFAGGLRTIGWIPLVAGWIVIGMLALTAWRALFVHGSAADWQRGRFVWAALVGYVLLLVLIWPLPNARYLVPVAPLLILGVLHGGAAIGEMARRPWLGRGIGCAFLASLVIVNLSMFAIDVAVQRRGCANVYYATYEAGLHESLLRSVRHLRDEDVGDKELAVSERYENLNRMRFSRGGSRNLVMLLDRRVVRTPEEYSFVPSRIPSRLFRRGQVLPGGFAQWAAAQNPPVGYYLYQQPTEPWRLWHFRLTSEQQQRLTGKPPQGDAFGWLLFTADDGFRNPVALPAEYDAPTRIPGL